MAKLPIDHILSPLNKFIHQEFTGGIILFVSVVIAILWANSSWSASYYHLWEMNLSVNFAGKGIDQPLHIWINDGLMALFFFVIGLELKREFIAGELSSLKKASLPMMAALGGMLLPALIYIVFNHNLPSSHGWGIPMATDIAFALALLSLAGKHIPASIKVFLSALAVTDDLGAVLVIAFFYTTHIAFFPLIIAVSMLLIMWLANALGVRGVLFYLIAGLAVWAGFLFSGIHATIAGVLVAFTIPARTKIKEQEYVGNIKKHTEAFETEKPLQGPLTTTAQHHIIEKMKALNLDAETPLQKIEYALHPWVAFIIMPLFALANAGMDIGTNFFTAILNPVSLGIIMGLVIGKFVGVLLFTWLMIKFRLSDMPFQASWRHITGIALLAGVGFTMSLFISGLAFDNASMMEQSKYGILLASLIAGTVGIFILKKTSRQPVQISPQY